MPKPKQATSYRLPDDAKSLLDAIAETTGTPKTYVIAEAIRDLAKKRGIGAIEEKPKKSRKTA